MNLLIQSEGGGYITNIVTQIQQTAADNMVHIATHSLCGAVLSVAADNVQDFRDRLGGGKNNVICILGSKNSDLAVEVTYKKIHETSLKRCVVRLGIPPALCKAPPGGGGAVWPGHTHQGVPNINGHKNDSKPIYCLSGLWADPKRAGNPGGEEAGGLVGPTHSPLFPRGGGEQPQKSLNSHESNHFRWLEWN